MMERTFALGSVLGNLLTTDLILGWMPSIRTLVDVVFVGIDEWGHRGAELTVFHLRGRTMGSRHGGGEIASIDGNYNTLTNVATQLCYLSGSGDPFCHICLYSKRNFYPGK